MLKKKNILLLLTFSSFLRVLLPGEAGCVECFQVVDDFEQVCGDLPCGWTLERGLASQVSTFHQAEHGLRLESNSEVSAEVFGLHRALNFAAQCDGATLTITARDSDQAVLDSVLIPAAMLDTEFFERHLIFLSLEEAATTIHIGTDGGGACVIDKFEDGRSACD